LLGVQRLKDDAGPEELVRRLSFAPMLNLNGLKSGYLGEGSHTILPNEARATADFRMPPGFTIEAVLDALRAHLDRRGFSDIEVVMDSGYPAARTPFEAPVVQAMLDAYRALGVEPVVDPIEPSATPYYLYTDVLGIPFVWGGLGWAGGSHGPDERQPRPGRVVLGAGAAKPDALDGQFSAGLQRANGACGGAKGNTMTFKALIFDMDGTLLDNMHVHNTIWSEYLAERGIQLTPNEIGRQTASLPNPQIIRMYFGSKVEPDQAIAMATEKEDRYRARLASGAIEPLPGLRAFFDQIAAAELPRALASSASRVNLDFTLRALRLERFFHAVISSEDVQRGKPDPEPFLTAAARLGVSPAECLVFEDSPFGLEAVALWAGGRAARRDARRGAHHKPPRRGARALPPPDRPDARLSGDRAGGCAGRTDDAGWVTGSIHRRHPSCVDGSGAQPSIACGPWPKKNSSSCCIKKAWARLSNSDRPW